MRTCWQIFQIKTELHPYVQYKCHMPTSVDAMAMQMLRTSQSMPFNITPCTVNFMLTKKHDHITPVLKELHWLPVRKRIEFKILLLAYMCLHGTAPSYLREMLKEYVPPRKLRSTSKNLLCEPRTNMKTYGDRSFSACAPKL